ncbi:hypothetical protein [Streptomyces sp. NBC_00162]|uniref:hypothetical protein n=1 Tax=Streptomyces sp. NBC_00162 TaxID=2903629 RepID=UPI00214CEF17|nr:hypothetical protein [Streptomyces sp. NBC_00162]UUU45111.1 hypothetical protein JIW86_40945 [Streptomyces sp. NBC_00162]
MCFEEWVDFLFRTADGHGGDAEELAEEVHGGEFAQVEHSYQDSVGRGEFGFGTCARGHQALVTATRAEHVLALNLQLGSQGVDELAELLAGHTGQFRVLQ